MLLNFILLLGGVVIGVFITYIILWKSNLRNVQQLGLFMQERKFFEQKLSEKDTLNRSLEEKIEKLNSEVVYFSNQVSVLQSELRNHDFLKKSQTELYQKFELISQKVIDQGNKNLVLNNKQELDKLMNPLKTKIGDFEKQVKECYDRELRDKVSLKTEIGKLLEMNCKLSAEAENLTNALKGDNKIQGNWGEVILESILDRSGLQKGVEYEVQVVSENGDGDKIKPDVIIHLPENKHVIIDAKVSLKSYDDFVNSTVEEDRMQALAQHLKSLKSHIELLSKKSYQSSERHHSLDFVLMFIPIESSYFLVLQNDQNLFWDAWEKKILIVSPATLHSTLKIIVALWKQEKQSKNVQEIAKLSGSLYDKFVGFVEDMQKIGRSINQADQVFGNAMQKLSYGRGNLLSKFEKIKTLGAKTSKPLPVDMIKSDKDS